MNRRELEREKKNQNKKGSALATTVNYGVLDIPFPTFDFNRSGNLTVNAVNVIPPGYNDDEGGVGLKLVSYAE